MCCTLDSSRRVWPLQCAIHRLALSVALIMCLCLTRTDRPPQSGPHSLSLTVFLSQLGPHSVPLSDPHSLGLTTWPFQLASHSVPLTTWPSQLDWSSAALTSHHRHHPPSRPPPAEIQQLRQYLVN